MKIIPTAIAGVLLLEPRVFADGRGVVFEAWNHARHSAAGLTTTFVQDNVSVSGRGVLRGLHYQHPGGQAKLVSVLRGEVLDVAVDIRSGSPTFGQSVAMVLSDENRRQLLIPCGFAHGFQVTSANAIVSYKCSDYYHPEAEHTIRWNDPDLAIAWPISAPVLSEKDRDGVRLRDIPFDRLPAMP